ncbi:hypothetical protein NCS56_00903200 [Fusarium sp. Ph1]|nr:hypothetical protein NCS56_00903200 [Fusarium sp. Ph1]
MSNLSGCAELAAQELRYWHPGPDSGSNTSDIVVIYLFDVVIPYNLCRLVNPTRDERLGSNTNDMSQRTYDLFLTTLLLDAPIVHACGNNAYRCKNPDASIEEMWRVTHQICNDLGEDDCYCYHWAEYFCDPSGDNIDKFKQKCQDHACVTNKHA